MKRNILQWTGIAALSALSLTACHPDKVTEEPILATLLSVAVRSAASGNCAISINGTGLYFGAVKTTTIGGGVAGLEAAAYADFIAHYNSINGTSVSAATLNAEPYNKKFDTFYTDSSSWDDTKRAALMTTVSANGTAITAAGLTALKDATGTAILACAKIPRTSCSVAGLTTANRTTDISNQRAIYETLLTEGGCYKPTHFNDHAFRRLFRGLPNDVAVANYGNNPSTNRETTGGFSTTTAILAEKAYPKFGSLVSLGFGALMPMNGPGVSYSFQNANTAHNISTLAVDSCESLGLTLSPSVELTVATPKALSPNYEVAYSISTLGSAANTYAKISVGNTFDGATTAVAAADAPSCNNSLRARFSIPLSLNGPTKLPSAGNTAPASATALNSGSGDGLTDLLSLCVYGKDATARANLRGVIANGILGNAALQAQIATCGEGKLADTTIKAALEAASAKFVETGLNSFTTYPNGQ